MNISKEMKIKQFISKEVLSQVPDDIRYIIKSLVYDSKRNWEEVLKLVLKYMPELQLKLKVYEID